MTSRVARVCSVGVLVFIRSEENTLCSHYFTTYLLSLGKAAQARYGTCQQVGMYIQEF
jgi:hypothetical protein